MQIIEALNNFFSGPVMVCGMLISGVVLTAKTGFVQFRRFSYTFKNAVYTVKDGINDRKNGKKNSGEGISPFEAVSTALSGTLGTGNIAGVAAAVAIGGAGALFWMWISAFLGMATKYSEIVLALKYRQKTKDGYLGGAMYYIKEATGSKFLAAVFAVFCLLASFGIGNMTQSNTAAVSLLSIFKMDKSQIAIVFICLSILLCIVIFGGISRISKITSFITPFMAVFYILCCLFVIFSNLTMLPGIFSDIIKSAFSLKSAVGGVAGYGMIKAMQIGFARGIFTNEAGLGSAPIAHAAAQNKLPALQGLWGIFEVFLDTTFMCTLTGLVILISGVEPSADMTIRAFSQSLGGYAGFFVGISTILFALSTIIGWSYYGEVAVNYLFKSKTAITIYKLIYSACVYFGAVSSVSLVWELSDVLNGFMIIPNLLAVLLLSNVVKGETKRLDQYINDRRKSKRDKKTTTDI